MSSHSTTTVSIYQYGKPIFHATQDSEKISTHILSKGHNFLKGKVVYDTLDGEKAEIEFDGCGLVLIKVSGDAGLNMHS